MSQLNCKIVGRCVDCIIQMRYNKYIKSNRGHKPMNGNGGSGGMGGLFTIILGVFVALVLFSEIG